MTDEKERKTPVPRYDNFAPASANASAAARGASRKSDTKSEVLLRRALWSAGLRYRKNVAELPGKPDIVFNGARVVVFCDGDFWHGRNWVERKRELLAGTNPGYWIAKIERNMQRDREHTLRLERDRWRVLRFWEADVLRQRDRVVTSVIEAIRSSVASSRGNAGNFCREKEGIEDERAGTKDCQVTLE